MWYTYSVFLSAETTVVRQGAGPDPQTIRRKPETNTMDNKDLKKYVEYLPVPMCILDDRGRIIAASPAMSKVFLYGDIEGRDIFVLTNVKYKELLDKKESGTPFNFSNNKMTFRVNVSSIAPETGDGPEAGEGGAPKEYITLTFTDISGVDELWRRYNNEKPYVIVVDIDNYNELIGNTEEENRQSLRSTIDRQIRLWGMQMKASVTRYSARRYIMFAEKKYVDEQVRSRFRILDEVRKIDSEADFPVTLSIGVGTGGEDMIDNHRFANQAMDMAKGRGGDQAVIKNGQDLTYYGGTTQSVEKGNKGKSMLIGYALRGLFDTASTIFIMGHKNPDMDAFGSALGVGVLARQRGKRAFIVVDKTTEALDLLYNKVIDDGQHEIISSERALELQDDKSVVVMVDTHRVWMSECPELYKRAVRTVVIDHHRQAEAFEKEPTLSYMESYASSASELVTEILQYTVERKDILNIEADALLAGIIVDTNNYWMRSGVRTFEASAWLRRAGADSVTVKKYFQISDEIFWTKVRCNDNAILADNGAAYAFYDGESENAQVANAQVADDLLTVRGVRASFVASRNSAGKTLISARSLDDVNVQVIMEHFDGGGHLNMAGSATDEAPSEIIAKIRAYIEEEGLM